MRRLLTAFLALSSTASAQTIECPKFYPWQDTPIAEVPHQHKGKGFVARAKLNGAGLFTGEMNGQGEMIGDRRKVKGGINVHYGFAPPETKWFVCSYGSAGDITWWEQLDRKATSCNLEIRESGRDPMSARIRCE
jgi:hypothetical protein